jgi:S13-like protein
VLFAALRRRSTVPLPPPLTADERREALEKAAQARKERAELKVSLKQGDTTLEILLDRTDEKVVGSMKVTDVLESMPGVGPVRAQKIMDRLAISSSRRLRGLGEKQRRSLIQEFSA